jgi:hypothetical protein
MRLPFADKNEFDRLPGERPACAGFFRAKEINDLLEKNEKKVLGTAARFLQVAETEIVEVIPFSEHTVNIIFAEKPFDMYDYGDE